MILWIIFIFYFYFSIIIAEIQIKFNEASQAYTYNIQNIARYGTLRDDIQEEEHSINPQIRCAEHTMRFGYVLRMVWKRS